LRVEIPFSSDTPNRVPAGTRIFSLELVRCVGAGVSVAATAAGEFCWGPSGCCANALGAVERRIREKAVEQKVPATRERAFGALGSVLMGNLQFA